MASELPGIYRAALEAIAAIVESISGAPTSASGIQTYIPITSEVWATFMAETDTGRREIVRWVSQRRMQFLSSTNLRAPTMTSQGPEGRFLAYDPDDSLSDGAAMVATSGFYTFDNMPPAALWLDFIVEPTRRASVWTPFSAYILCWVPAQLTALADEGIAVNAEQCLRWWS